MGAVNHSLSPSFFSRKSGYWTHCSWKTFLATKAFRPKLLKCHCVNSAFPGHSMKMQILIQGALSFCIFNKLPRDTDSAGQGNSHFYSKTLCHSEQGERQENVICQPWHGVGIRGQPEHLRDPGSNLGSVQRCVTEPSWASESSSAKMEHFLKHLRRLNEI